MIVGGTGFYIQAVLYDIDFTENDGDDAYRQELADYADANGPLSLHERLRQVDPKAADAIHPNNTKRFIRALEFRAQ